MKTSITGEAEETCLGKSPGLKTLVLIVRLLYIFNRLLCLLSIKIYSNNHLQNFVMSLEVKKTGRDNILGPTSQFFQWADLALHFRWRRGSVAAILTLAS